MDTIVAVLENDTSSDKLTVCWLGNPRYSQPLNPTDDKKWELLNGLGVRMFVIGFAAGFRPRRFTQHARFYLLPNLPLALLRYLEMFILTPLLLSWLVARHRVRIIIAQSPFEGAVGALVKNVYRVLGISIKLIVESHGNFEVSVLGQRQVFSIRLYRWLMSHAARYGLRYADVLRAVSGSTRQQLQHWQPGTPIIQFMAWTDAASFNVPRQLPVSRARDILYAGVLIPLKEVHTLIDAFAAVAPEVQQAHLWLVGKPENESYAASLRQQVQRLGLGERVTFVGAVTQQELGGYMGRARALVLASRSEGLPRVVVEAMLNGLVVIASRVSGIPEIVEDGVTGYLVPPQNVEALTDAIRAMYHNPNVEDMALRAQQSARTLFSPEAYLDGHRRMIEAALETEAR
ncbi:MAG: glycosyltransferase family 4 protein [Anaerolineae bacterium]